MDINKIQSALQLLQEERTHIDEYIQNAASRKKELDKELKATFDKLTLSWQTDSKNT